MNLLKLFPIAVLLLSSLIGCAGEDPADFARSGFSALARGDSSAEDLIDWDALQVAGNSVSMAYKQMPTEQNKADFRAAFVSEFSANFQAQGASADSLTGWDVESDDSARTVVSATAPNGNKIKITVSKKNGGQKISALDF